MTSFPPQDPLRILLCRLCPMTVCHFVDRTDGDVITKCRLLCCDWSDFDGGALKRWETTTSAFRNSLSGPTFLIPEFIFIILFSIVKSICCISLDFYLKGWIYICICVSLPHSVLLGSKPTTCQEVWLPSDSSPLVMSLWCHTECCRSDVFTLLFCIY